MQSRRAATVPSAQRYRVRALALYCDPTLLWGLVWALGTVVARLLCTVGDCMRSWVQAPQRPFSFGCFAALDGPFPRRWDSGYGGEHAAE